MTPAPTYKAKKNPNASNKANSAVWGPYFCSYVCLAYVCIYIYLSLSLSLGVGVSKRIPKKDFKPLSGRLKIFHRHFQNVFHCPKFARQSGPVRPRQGTEICHWIFCFFSSAYVQFSKTSPLKSGESSENPVEKIASNPVTSVAVMVFSALKQEIQYFFTARICRSGHAKRQQPNDSQTIAK